MQRIFLLLAAALTLFAPPALAKDAGARNWIVSQQSGSAQVLRNGLQPVAVTTNATLRSGDTIVTGTDGRVVLTRAGDYIVVAPGSRLLLPPEEQAGGFTRLIQQVGTMLYKVRHTGVPHFRVDAPMLAAVVKGTSFTVIVGPDRSAVQVTDGLVEVIAADGGMSRLVEKSETVFVNRDRPTELVEANSENAVAPIANESEQVYKIDESSQALLTPIAVLTSGLARDIPQQPLTNAGLQSGGLADPAGSLVIGTTTTASAVAPVAAGLVEGSVTTLSGVVGGVAPAANNIVSPVVNNVVAPVASDVVAPVVNNVVAPVVTEVVAPVVSEVVAPVVAEVVTPVVNEIVAPVVTQVVAPVVTEVVGPVVTEVVAPTVPEVVAPVVDGVLGPLLPFGR